MTSIKTNKNLAELFIEDFEIQHQRLDEETKTILRKKSGTLFSLYFIDFLVCHLVIGKKYKVYMLYIDPDRKYINNNNVISQTETIFVFQISDCL